MKNFRLFMTEILHTKIKVASAKAKMPMNDFIILAIEEKLSRAVSKDA